MLTSDLGADRVYVHHWEHGELVREGEVVLEPGTGPRDQHLLPVASDDLAHDWRVAVVGEWGGTAFVHPAAILCDSFFVKEVSYLVKSIVRTMGMGNLWAMVSICVCSPTMAAAW